MGNKSSSEAYQSQLFDDSTPNVTSSESKSNKFFNDLCGLFAKKFSSNRSSLKESLEEYLEEDSTNDTPLDAGERAIIRNVLEFKEIYVEDVMIPRTEVYAIKHDVTEEELHDKLHDKTYTRIPVYENDLDQIIGFVHIKDIAKFYFKKQPIDISKIVRSCLFVPPSMKISNLLIRMQQERVHIAVVVDEYGGTEGIITLEDIIEEIIGKIEDEHDGDFDNAGTFFQKLSENSFEVSARMKISDFEVHSGIRLNFSKENLEDFNTINGMIIENTGRIPAKGEIVTINDYIKIKVKSSDPRKINRVILTIDNAKISK